MSAEVQSKGPGNEGVFKDLTPPSMTSAAHHLEPGSARPTQERRPLKSGPRAGHLRRQRLGRATIAVGLRVLGELGPTGKRRMVSGTLSVAIVAAEAGRVPVGPPGNAAETALAEHADVRAAQTLLECCASLDNQRLLPLTERVNTTRLMLSDLADVCGRHMRAARCKWRPPAANISCRSAALAAAKPCRRRARPACCRAPTTSEALQPAASASVSGEGLDQGRWRQRPLGALNQSASVAALLGDGNPP